MEAKEITVAFSGHRTFRGEAEAELRQIIASLYEEGYRRFLCGMAWGFDLAAGEAVDGFRQHHPDVELIAVLPYGDFGSLFKGDDAMRFRSVAESADEVVVVCEHQGPDAYRRRNDYLVENASRVVAWWDGVPKGGTAYTLKRARRLGLRVHNLYPSAQLALKF